MRRIRIGNDITIYWKISSAGEAVDLSKYGVKITLSTRYDETVIDDYSIGADGVIFSVKGATQKRLGVYTATIELAEGGDSLHTRDACDIFELVPRSCLESGSDEIGVKTETLNIESEISFSSGPSAADGAVRYDEVQSLTASEQQTARENIGAVSVEEVNGKQDALTLTVKDNGNIVIGNLAGQSKEFMPATPSGDPMHYAYAAAGAEYNDTGADVTKTAPWGDSVTHKAGCWYLNGLGDLMNEEMVEIYNEAHLNYSSLDTQLKFCASQQRTNICNARWNTSQAPLYMFLDAKKIEVISLGENKNFTANVTNANGMFNGCTSLRYVINTIQFYNHNASYTSNLFRLCGELRSAKLRFVGSPIDLSATPYFFLSDLLYMIQNASPGKSFTITLQADVHAAAMNDPEIQSALTANQGITLASA